MVNLLLFQYKYLGSIALKCGASHFGFKSIGQFTPLQQLVIIFKASNKCWDFLDWLEGPLDKNKYYHREVHHKGEGEMKPENLKALIVDKYFGEDNKENRLKVIEEGF